MPFFQAESAVALGNLNVPLPLRCPACRQNGTFERIGDDMQISGAAGIYRVGHRRCPNPACHTHIFVTYDPNTNALIATYPPEVIDFDSTNVPTPVVEALEEAIKCHANECYIAAAIMVRKTLEELCADKQAIGANLKERIRALSANVRASPGAARRLGRPSSARQRCGAH